VKSSRPKYLEMPPDTGPNTDYLRRKGAWKRRANPSGEDDPQADSAPTDYREIWDAVVPDSDVAEYLQHEQAMQEYEGKKLNRLQLMTWAQRTRTRFLSLSMADRKIFLDVLTADENGSFTRMFALQARIEANGVTDKTLLLKKVAVKALKSGGRGDNAIQPVRKQLKKQAQEQAREQKLLTDKSPILLPARRVLSLPGQTPKWLTEQEKETNE
jgi:hypothetical protein